MPTISWIALSWCVLPVAIVAVLYWRWLGNRSEVLIASARMTIQLIAVGYVLVVLFGNPSISTSLLVMAIMMVAASWIAIRPVRNHPNVWQPAAAALIISVSSHLAISIGLVLDVPVWYEPRVLIPLAGMYFSNTMTTISLAAERYFSERQAGQSPFDARNNAFRAAMIPQINGLLAVGLVALPGMMTGQILSGVSPLIAVRYQILIMTMMLGTCGVGSALLLWQLKRRDQK